ncbi:SDR family NAD(P)-dependent oxidoreductase [Halobaculum sp. MBLA0147]|uniref:SDR family NAD(P)-dependent oxidoreductase n=1 Tax=Halobaculum sp. MBLA0147 TaxID=3079934 RepID=UPI003524826C
MESLDPDLTGRTALVTGSADRVGREILLRLADAGADVAVHHRSSSTTASETAADARERGVDATVVRGDVTEPDAVDAFVGECESALGTVDVLVNAVGPLPGGRWDELSYDQWQTTVAGCLYGTYLCSHRVLPAMRDAEWGRIVNFGVADARDDRAVPENFPYFAAKKTVLLFTRTLAYDTQTAGITVNAVSPFAVENTVVDDVDYPRGRPASFDDVAAPILFFCSAAASYISGQNVAVDGGRLQEAN